MSLEYSGYYNKSRFVSNVLNWQLNNKSCHKYRSDYYYEFAAELNQSCVSFVKRHPIICWHFDRVIRDWLILAAKPEIPFY